MAIMSEMGACPSASPAGNGERTPTRRIRARCCARASSGQATAVPPRNVMNSRRRVIRSQAQETQHCIDAFPSAMKRATMRREPPERPHCTARCDAVMP
jgi:hypothetical protein